MEATLESRLTMGDFTLAGRRVVVVGAARSGVAAAALAAARGARVTLTDLRPEVPRRRMAWRRASRWSSAGTGPARSPRPTSSC